MSKRVLILLNFAILAGLAMLGAFSLELVIRGVKSFSSGITLWVALQIGLGSGGCVFAILGILRYIYLYDTFQGRVKRRIAFLEQNDPK